MTTAEDIKIRIVGSDPNFGLMIITARGQEITCHVDAGTVTTPVRYKCSSCGRLGSPCRHISLAIAARAIQFRGDQP